MNTPARRGPIARFFIGLWDAVNFTRRLVLNLLFLGLLLLLLAVLASGGRNRALLDRTTLVVAPEGRLVEQYTIDPASRALSRVLGDKRDGEVQLRDLLRALDAARTDKRIERVLLDLDALQPSGIAPARTVAEAVRKLRGAGKQVVAYGQGFDQANYLIAAQANEVYVDPMGEGVPLVGFASYGPYMREALQDKLGVDVHVFKVGQFKSAVEPFVLDGASPAAKEADLYWMNDVWQRHLADIASARKLQPAQLAAAIDGMPAGVEAAGGDMARYALQQKLVDGLKTREEVDDLLAERGMADDDAPGGFRQVDVGAYLAHVDGALSAVDERPQVAVVVAEGEIADGEQPAGMIGGESTAALLRAARDDENVKAVVLRVNSPGGSAYASEVIGREVVALKAAGKPVVASMGHVAASGGYWISMNADRIYADASTITGSIGVFGMVPTIPRTLEKIGVHTDGVATTRFAGAFDITRPLDPDVGRMIQAGVEHIYREFTGRVAKGRNRPVAQIEAVAQGRVWTGAQAKQRGLVDELGGLDAAVADAATRAKLGKPDSYRVRYIEKAPTPFAQWMTAFAGTRIGAGVLRESGIARVLAAGATPQVDARLRMVESVLRERRNGPARALAYCFCGL